MKRVRTQSATIRARRLKAHDNFLLAVDLLATGEVLRVSNRTDRDDKVVHYSVANRLVRQGKARYVSPNEIIRKHVATQS